MPQIKIKYVSGHYEVFRDGVFLFSADTMSEAVRELEQEEEENG